MDRTKQYPILTLDEGWEIARNGQPQEGTVLSEAEIVTVYNGDTFVITTTLPKEPIRSAALRITAKQILVKLFLDDTYVYGYGEELHKQGRMLKRGFLTVPLPEGWEGKTTDAVLLSIAPVLLTMPN